MAVEEWLDIVDGEDRVVGRAERGDAHRRGLRHRAVHVLVYDVAGHLFVQRRGLAKATNPGLLDTSAAGHVESGESRGLAAVREVEEELGILLAADELERLFVMPPELESGNEFVTVFRAVTDRTPVLQLEEIEDGEFVEPLVLASRIARDPDRFTSVFREILRRLDSARRRSAV